MKWLLILIPTIFITLIYSPVKFNIFYKVSNGYDKLKISTSYLFGLFKPEFQPFKKKGNENESSPIIRYFWYEELIKYTCNRMIIEYINWETTIGYSDPFYLSIIYGSIWWLKGIIISILMSNKDIQQIDTNVIPIYDKNQFDMRFNCIIKIRMVYIITIWIWFLKIYKGGEKIDRSSNRRLNENYNE
ncbi:DUF2953 domain-containing protein [Schnuerera sp. xch1]|uniref:DUF2953 domain-containing protein n=1 Tax=Schnuerera sp. xch1 TaxID=2874283 RepID=UPI001CBE05C6|nr:DUF2953 domain-containing protein [Schnuerera sp. xch1]MBZ2173777.1 DUF2953 domain-containing protein [Schnuerera sp. xch1]